MHFLAFRTATGGIISHCSMGRWPKAARWLYTLEAGGPKALVTWQKAKEPGRYLGEGLLRAPEDRHTAVASLGLMNRAKARWIAGEIGADFEETPTTEGV